MPFIAVRPASQGMHPNLQKHPLFFPFLPLHPPAGSKNITRPVMASPFSPSPSTWKNCKYSLLFASVMLFASVIIQGTGTGANMRALPVFCFMPPQSPKPPPNVKARVNSSLCVCRGTGRALQGATVIPPGQGAFNPPARCRTPAPVKALPRDALSTLAQDRRVRKTRFASTPSRSGFRL